MKASDLRIGNLVLVDLWEKPYTAIVTAINGSSVWVELEGFLEDDLDRCHELSAEYLMPIPVNEEWLLNFGFVKVHDVHWGQLFHYEYDICYGFRIKKPSYANGLPSGFILKGDIYPNIIYVHKLQNFYFSLEDKELQLTTEL